LGVHSGGYLRGYIGDYYKSSSRRDGLYTRESRATEEPRKREEKTKEEKKDEKKDYALVFGFITGIETDRSRLSKLDAGRFGDRAKITQDSEYVWVGTLTNLCGELDFSHGTQRRGL
jgi:hypothetical protein